MAHKFTMAYTIDSRKDGVFLDRHGCKHVEFEIDDIVGLKNEHICFELWKKVGEILVGEARKLNVKEDDLYMSNLTREMANGKGSLLVSNFQDGEEYAGFNILLDEIIRLRRKLEKSKRRDIKRR